MNIVARDLCVIIFERMYRPQRFRPFAPLWALLLLLPLHCRADDRVNLSVSQLIIGLAPTWDSMNGQLQRFDRNAEGWRAAGPPVPVLFGKSGLAWGRGLITRQDQGPDRGDLERVGGGLLGPVHAAAALVS